MDCGEKKTGKLPYAFVAHTDCHPRIPLLVPVSLCCISFVAQTVSLCCISLFLIFSFFTAAQAQVAPPATDATVNVAAVVKPRHIQLGEKARLELTISGDTFIKHIKAPTFNFLPAFLAVPLHSETVPRLASDKIAVSMAWVYELIPQAVGNFTLSDIRFAYQDALYFANPGSIRVSGSDTYQDALTGGVHQVEVEVDTDTPYLNAPLQYTFRYLYTAVLPTRESPSPRLPEFRDFFVETLQKRPLYTRDIRGKTFWVEERTRTLYPKRPGQIVLAPAELLLPLPQGRKTLKTKPLTLTVQPIPETGRSPHFKGAIGTYEISAILERGSVEVGQALTLTVHISGQGNIQTVTPPNLPTIPGVMVGGANWGRSDTFGITPTSRTYVYTLTPSQVGTLRIPPIIYTYFDPSRATYATIHTLPIPLSVRPDPNDTVDIDTEDRSWGFWVVLLLAILVIGGLIAGFLWYRAGLQMPLRRSARPPIGARTPENSETDDRETRRSAAAPATPGSHAQDAIAGLASTDTTQEVSPFANTLAQVLYGYLEGTLALSQRDIATVRQVCTQAEVTDTVLEALVELLTTCDYYRFAPVPLSADERDALIARAERVIEHIENHCRIAC